MPRKITDDQGQEIEVYDKAELEAIKQEADSKIKELEQEVNPNFREMRQKYEQAIKDKKAADDKLKEFGVKEEGKTLSEEEIARIADRQYTERYKERVFDAFGDKKDVVKKYYEKLSQGENIKTEADIERIAQEAARTAGLPSKLDTPRVQYPNRSSRPEFDMGGKEEGFGGSEAGKSTAAAMGLIIENPNKK